MANLRDIAGNVDEEEEKKRQAMERNWNVPGHRPLFTLKQSSTACRPLREVDSFLGC